MGKRVNLDAMIPRADFGELSGSSNQESLPSFSLSDLDEDSPTLKALRKPDFQRETNHWSGEQVVTLVQSFLDDELVPSLILWDSNTYMFVIDGGHRLSALRAWITDDYGDGPITQKFYSGNISRDQRQAAKSTRNLIEQRIGRFADLKRLVAQTVASDPEQLRRANRMFRRVLNLQWVKGTKDVAESSFFKINSQGTPLDAVETSLIVNRRKPIAIAARAIIRAGQGHKYWADFDQDKHDELVELSKELYTVLFEPEIDSPVKTLDIPLGGSVSPVEALALLIEFLSIAGRAANAAKNIADYSDDRAGAETVAVLRRTLLVVQRMTTNSSGSLGLHPAVYYYSDKGKHSRFLFLGMTELISQQVINNNSAFFKKLSGVRGGVERFLIENKPMITGLLQNLNNKVRISKMRDLFSYVINELAAKHEISPESALRHLGIEGKVYDLSFATAARDFSDEVKSMTFVKRAIQQAIRCPQCDGLLDPARSVSYDHIERVRDGGTGDAENCQMMHPFCNTAMKS